MLPEEFAALARVEERHWFYRGKRELARRWLERLGAPPGDDLLVDVGAGAGLFATEMRHHRRILAIDPDPHALQFIRRRAALPAAVASATALPLADGSAAAPSALDVIEHLDDDADALREFCRVVRPGGAIVITVPALPALWSEWDETLGHRRRYTRATLAARRRPIPVRAPPRLHQHLRPAADPRLSRGAAARPAPRRGPAGGPRAAGTVQQRLARALRRPGPLALPAADRRLAPRRA